MGEWMKPSYHQRQGEGAQTISAKEGLQVTLVSLQLLHTLRYFSTATTLCRVRCVAAWAQPLWAASISHDGSMDTQYLCASPADLCFVHAILRLSPTLEARADVPPPGPWLGVLEPGRALRKGGRRHGTVLPR